MLVDYEVKKIACVKPLGLQEKVFHRCMIKILLKSLSIFITINHRVEAMKKCCSYAMKIDKGGFV